MWKCQCECGGYIEVKGSLFGKVTHCGCEAQEVRTGTRLYGIWRSMIARCSKTPSSINSWESYGGRGIQVCDEWSNKETGFTGFKKWAESSGYVDGLTIDRIDVDGDYSPDNCKWATQKEQGRNKRNNRKIEYNGESKCLSEWSEVLNIPRDTLARRIDVLNWSLEKAFTTPVRKRKDNRKEE